MEIEEMFEMDQVIELRTSETKERIREMVGVYLEVMKLVIAEYSVVLGILVLLGQNLNPE